MEIEKASVLTEAFSIGAAEVDSATPELKDVAYSCCSIFLAVKLEQVVRQTSAIRICGDDPCYRLLGRMVASWLQSLRLDFKLKSY